MAKQLGVTANTVARWECCEILIPRWVDQLHNLETMLSSEVATRNGKIEKLQKDIEGLREKIQMQGWEIMMLKQEKATLKALRTPTASGLLRQFMGASSAEEFHRELVKRFHPDRNPEHAEVMTTINEVYQTLTRR